MADYGPLATMVAYAGNLGAAAVAIRGVWAGRMIWEPKVKDFPRAPTRLTSVICIVGIAIVFASTRAGTPFWPLAKAAIVLAGVALGAFLIDVIVRAVAVIRCTEQEEGVIGGLWIRKNARRILDGDRWAYKQGHLSEGQKPPESARAFYCSFPKRERNRAEDMLWTPGAQGVSRAMLILAYCLWFGAATLAVSCSSILIETALRAT